MKIGKTLEFDRQRICHGNLRKMFREKVDENSILIASATSLRKMYNTRLLSLKDIASRQIVWGINKSFDAYNSLSKVNTYIGFGGGTAIDIAKYLATANNARCIAIPSMLSTNAFATNKVAKVTPDNKITVDAVLPDEIWYDDEVINLSKRENIFGLADAFSIYTALYDWEISSEKIDSNIYTRSWDTYVRAIDFVHDCKSSQREIFNILLEAGYVTNDYGSGRPESGSEHIIAKEIEKIVKVPHALAVVCGICISSLIQNRPSDEYTDNYTAFDAMGMFKAIHTSIPPSILKQALLNVRPRDDRETCLDRDCFVQTVDIEDKTRQIEELISRSVIYYG